MIDLTNPSPVTRYLSPFKVLLKKGEFIDASRGDRVVPYKIYYPADSNAGKIPIIIWSHGFGGNRDGAAFLSRFLAGQGYAVVQPTHIGTDSSLWEGKPGHPWDILKDHKVPRAVTLERFRDIPFVLDQLPQWAAANPDVPPLDFSKIGMSGHSFGALTTQVMAGQMIPDLNDRLISLHEPRFKAGIAYSPVPIGHMIEDTGEVAQNIYGPIAMPLLHMTGTEDSSPIGGEPYQHRLIVYESTGHPEKYLLVKEGGDHMVYNGTRGKLAENPLRETHEEIIKAVSLAFWDAQLKGDERAREWLAKAHMSDYLLRNAEFRMEVK